MPNPCPPPFSVIVVLGIRLWLTLLVASALGVIGRSRSPRSATVPVEDSVAGRLVRARMTITIVIKSAITIMVLMRSLVPLSRGNSTRYEEC